MMLVIVIYVLSEIENEPLSLFMIVGITYGKLTRGGLKVYIKGQKRKAFFVDAMCEGFNNFIKGLNLT